MCDAREKYGVDISSTAIENAKSRGINAIVVDIDKEQLLYGSNFFDGVLMVEL